MEAKDKNKIIDRYEKRLKELGPVQESLGWLKGRQKLRFYVLKNIDHFQKSDSVLDVGCAFGDLKQFLMQCGWDGKYIGVDIVPGLILQSRIKNFSGSRSTPVRVSISLLSLPSDLIITTIPDVPK